MFERMRESMLVGLIPAPISSGLFEGFYVGVDDTSLFLDSSFPGIMDRYLRVCEPTADHHFLAIPHLLNQIGV
jgi:hypothetical protein